MVERGDIIFVRGKGHLDSLIRFFDKGEFSHVAIALDKYHVLDARLLGGVKPRHFDFTDYEIVRLPYIDMMMLEQFIGREYDLLQFISYGFKNGNNVWNNPNKLICSELIAHAFMNAKLLNLSPNELYKSLMNLKETGSFFMHN